MGPKISVIIPVYNAEKYLSECFESVINQTLKEIEIIVVNDGSNDNSLQIIRKHEEKDPRIIVIDKANEGAGPSRNRGIDAATGEYVAFMDADDFYPSNDVLERIYAVAISEKVQIAGGKRVRLMEDMSLSYDPDIIEIYGEEFFANGITAYKDYQYDYGYTQYIYDHRMLIEKNIQFPNYKRFQDPPFFVQSMIAAKVFYFADFYTYGFRRVFQEADTKVKWSMPKAIDMIDGMIENLKLSRKHQLAKLHYLTAHRLNADGSYLAIRNFSGDSKPDELLSKLIIANNLVDVQWLKENGYELPEPFVLDAFKYVADTTKKYESLRNHRIIRILRKFRGKA